MRTSIVTLAALAIFVTVPSPTFAKGKCRTELADAAKSNKPSPPTVKKEYAKPEIAWGTSIDTLRALKEAVSGGDGFLHSLLTASLANEFAWINGDPGGAKTLLSRLVFQAQLNSFTETDKRIFLLQFHKLMTEGVITGFPKIKSMLEEGKYDIEPSSSLVGDQFIFAILDEAEKANPATLTALLSVLNERKAFLGSKVVDAMLSSGVITSNKTMAEFIQSSGDRPSFEALADRMGIKRHVTNQFATAAELVAMYKKTKGAKPPGNLVLPLRAIQHLVDQVELSGQIEKVATLITDLDGLFTTQADQSLAAIRRGENVPEYFPANQFSNRSAVRVLKLMKASFIAKQLMDGVPFDRVRTKMEGADLIHLATGALYGGPSQIRPKRYVVPSTIIKNAYGETLPFEVQWSPYDNTVYLRNTVDFQTYAVQVTDAGLVPGADLAAAGIEITTEINAKILKEAKKINTTQKINPAVPQFEVDGEITRLLAKKTIPGRTRYELETIEKDMQTFVLQLNALTIKKDVDPTLHEKILAQLGAQKRQIEEDDKKTIEALTNAKFSKLSEQKKQALYYEASQKALKHLKLMYPELGHAVDAFFVALMARTHLYIFGPPGGAKTSMARVIMGALLRWENLAAPEKMATDMNQFAEKLATELIKKDKGAAEIFFLQFHKLIPEGVIVGFPKLQEQIDSGTLKFDLSSSLAHEKFIYAILDEVEKGNPAVLTTLLSVLNEREVFAGNNVFKTGLRFAALTSNKMPSEFLDYFEDDRPTGQAISDRAINKVYVSNKFSSKETLMRFLLQIEAGLSPDLATPLPLEELRPLADKVVIEDYYQQVLAEIYYDFTAKQLEREETTYSNHLAEAAEIPNYFVKATTGSNRTFIALLDQLKSAFIVDQMARGVPYETLNYQFEMKDISIFLKGLGYWMPAEITSSFDSNGILKFSLAAPILTKLKNASYVNERNRFMLGEMYDGADSFVKIANNTITPFLMKYRDLVAKHPNLFPSFFASDEARAKFLKKVKGP